MDFSFSVKIKTPAGGLVNPDRVERASERFRSAGTAAFLIRQ